MKKSTSEKKPWCEKVAAARKRLKMNQKAFAEALGTTQSNVSKWESGEYRPSPQQFMRLAELNPEHPDSLAFMEWGGVPASWFLENPPKGVIPAAAMDHAVREAREARKAELIAEDAFAELTSETRSFPLLRNAAAAGSPRSISDRDIKEIVALPRSWLPRTGALYALRVQGDSMSPILRSGDIVIVDVEQREPKKLIERMVVARAEDGITIKWLRKDGELYLLVPQHTSPSHPVRVIRPESDIAIVGAVVKWIGEPPAPRK